MPSTRYAAMESIHIDFNNSTAIEENFETQIKRVYLSTDADCHIAFDTAATTDSFMLSPEDGILAIDYAQFTRLSVLGKSGSGVLSVLALRT